ncbi:MAG: transglycosylase domain-containing protein [Actinomycetota bacterium]
MNARRGPLIVGVVLLAVLSQACRLPDLPDLELAETQAEALPQTSFLYTADGTLITRLHAGENRVVVPFEKIPETVREAVVAVEDKRFYEHKGIDLRALLRAAYVDASSGRIVEGGSTITQQYVKNAYTGAEQTLSRKIREAALAWQLEQELTKDEILTRYLNTVYFGEGAYGIQSAAEGFFDRPARDLTLAQSALLAGLISAPVDYDPVTHPQRALERRNLVLRQMWEQGRITLAEYSKAAGSELRLRLPRDTPRYIAPHFVDYFEQWFLSSPRFGETQDERYRLLFEGGLRITTTLVPRLQEAAENAINSILIYRSDPYAAMTVIDPRNGYVKAMVGGRDYFSEHDRYARINLATGGITGRQAGSAFKPFALVAALESGIAPETVYPAPASIQLPLENGQVWSVQNYDGSSSGNLTLEQATIDSVNTVYAQLISDLGAQKVISVAKRMGIRCCRRTTEPGTDLKAFLSAVLGTNEVNTLEMASAYGSLATGGYHAQPTPVLRITTADGDVLYEAQPEPRLVVNAGVAAVASRILQEVVQYGTGTAANIGRPQLGKTGTAQEWRDAWFVGAIPQLTAAVWVGFPQGLISMTYPRVRLPHVLGGTWPAQIWRAFMINATAHMPIRGFPSTEVQYVTVAVDATQYPLCLPNQYTHPANIQTQIFIAGTEPTQTCTEPTSYALLTVPSVIGLSQDEATLALQAAGFNVSVVVQSSTTAPAGSVIGQDPAAGVQAQQASTVTITVAKTETSSPAPDRATIPNVLGLPQSAAEAAISQAGLLPAVITQAQCNRRRPECDYASGTVWSQSPGVGNTVEPGSTVIIWVNP